MFPNDNQQQQPVDNTTFSGSAMGAPQPAPSDPFTPAPMGQNSDTPNNTAPMAPAATPTPVAAPTDDHDAALNDFLSDESSPSFLSDSPTSAPSAPQVQATSLDDGDHNDLSTMKQQALTQLQPLVDHLDQTAEEQFKTTMMMIQATDDHRLLKKAFDSAQKIEDDKARAQALLDIINEINYFTANSVQEG